MLYSILLLILIVLAVSLYEKNVQENEYFQNVEEDNKCYGAVSSKTNNGKNHYFTNFMTGTYTNFDKLFKYFKKKTTNTVASLKDYKNDLDEAYSIDSQTTKMLIDTQDNVENTNNVLRNMISNKIVDYDNEKQRSEYKLRNIDNIIQKNSDIKKDEVLTNIQNVVRENARDQYNKFEKSVLQSDEIRAPFNNMLQTRISTEKNVQGYKWQCEPGIIGSPIRINPTNNSIECISKDGVSCDTTFCNNKDVRDIDYQTIKTVACNKKQLQDQSHWCNKSAKLLYDVNNTDYSSCPTNWTILDKKNMICKAPEGYSGTAQPNQMAGQYHNTCKNSNCQILNMNIADKRQWSRINNTWFPPKINIINKSLEMTNTSSQIDNVIKQTIGTATPPSRINNYKIYKNGSIVKAYKLKVGGNATPETYYSKGKLIFDSIITSSINFQGNGTLLGIRPLYSNPNTDHNTDDVFIVFSGYIKIPKKVYNVSFKIFTDDGVRFMIKKPKDKTFNTLINDFRDAGITTNTSQSISVEEDSYLEYVLEFFERGGSHNCTLQWSLNNNGNFNNISRDSYFIDSNKCSDNITLKSQNDWKCISRQNGEITPARLNDTNDVECMALDGRNCLWSRDPNQCNNDIAKHSDSGKLNNLACGQMHQTIYGSPGYNSGGSSSWCDNGRVAFDPTQKQTYTEDEYNGRCGMIDNKAVKCNRGRCCNKYGYCGDSKFCEGNQINKAYNG